jgi:hypothetical protein
MDHHLCVLLYSKYSPMSNKLMSALESCPINLTTTVGLSPVCIDNEEIREQILTANKIDISSVPCVLIVYRTGGIEKYEGGSAFNWVDETVRKYMPAPPPAIIPQQPPLPPQQQRPPRRHKREQEYQEPEFEEYESSGDDYVPIPEPPKRARRQKRSVLKRPDPVQKRPQTSETATLIEDLDSGSDEESSKIPARPPVGVRSGPGGYDMVSDFGELQESSRDATRHMKMSTQPATGQGNGLMAAAMAMQKERDAVDASKPRAVGSIPTNQRPI